MCLGFHTEPGIVSGRRNAVSTFVASKFTLDQVSINVALSQGSTAFTAHVYFENKLIGSARCRGCGDGTVFDGYAVKHVRGKVIQIDVDVAAQAAADDYVKAHPHPGKFSQGGIEDYIDDALTVAEVKSKLSRQLKKKCVYLTAGGDVRAFTQPLSADPVDRSRQLASFTELAIKKDPTAIVLNSLNLQEAAERVVASLPGVQ